MFFAKDNKIKVLLFTLCKTSSKFLCRLFLSVVFVGLCSAIYINEEANEVVQAILKHFDENPQDSRFEQVIFIPSDKCHLFPKVCSIICGSAFTFEVRGVSLQKTKPLTARGRVICWELVFNNIINNNNNNNKFFFERNSLCEEMFITKKIGILLSHGPIPGA